MNDGEAARPLQLPEKVKRHEIAADRNELASLHFGNPGHGREGVEGLDTMTGFAQGIARKRLATAGAIDDDVNALGFQAIEQPLDGRFRAAPLGWVVLP